MEPATPAAAEPFLRALARDGSGSSDFDLNPGDAAYPERLRPAGVLVALVTDRGRPGVILTQRSSSLRHHPGQIAFPGGKVDRGDGNATRAAIREAGEEVGLPADAVEVLGTLPPHRTVTGFSVEPVLARVTRSFDARPELGEVAEIFVVPLDHVLDTSNFHIQSRIWRGARRYYYAVPWGPYYIWGATARMLRALAERAGQ